MFFKSKRNALKKLVKDGNLSALKSIIENSDSSLATDATGTGTILLHLAVKYNKLELLEFLLNSQRVDINVQDSSGTTPILLALREQHFEAAKLLLEANALIDIPNTKGETPLTYILQYRLSSNKIIPDHVQETFSKKFFEAVNNETSKSVILAMYRSIPFKIALNLDSPDLMTMVLRSRNSISSSESRYLVIESMHSSNLDNLQVILTTELYSEERKKIFERELCLLINGSYPNLKLALTLIKQLIEWGNMITEDLTDYFKKVFEKGNVNAIKMLFESGIIDHVKELEGEDLTAHLFANKNKIVMQVLKDREFDVNAKGEDGLSALHFAVRSSSRKNAEFLIEKGANVNIKDDSGISPLFEETITSPFLKLLIWDGAEIHDMNDNEFDMLENDSVFSIKLQYILGHLAILESIGWTFSQRVNDRIESTEKFKKRYDKYRSLIDRMKNYEICESITMFTILTKNMESIERNLRSKQRALEKALADNRFWYDLLFNNTYYLKRLEESLSWALKICKLRNKAKEIVARSTQLFSADHLVVHKIVDYLTFDDLRLMFK